MAVPKEDWVKDTVWVEMHLTGVGWVRGTKRTEKGRFEYEIDPPPDTLMTVRCLECIPDDPKSKPTERTEIRWRVLDVEQIARAQSDWGVLPRHAPPLSADSALKHAALKNLPAMQHFELHRPLGKRLREEAAWKSADSQSVF
jgi:hypothetical protein